MKVSTPAAAPPKLVEAAVANKLKKSHDIGSLAAAAQMASRHKMDMSKIVTNHAENHPEELNNLHGKTAEGGSGLFFWIFVVALVIAVIGGIVYMAMKKEQDTKRFKY